MRHVLGWKIVVLLRLAPIVPFGACSHLLSMTSIPVRALLLQSVAIWRASDFVFLTDL